MFDFPLKMLGHDTNYIQLSFIHTKTEILET